MKKMTKSEVLDLSFAQQSALATAGKYCDYLVDSPHVIIRQMIAGRGIGLEKLAKDSSDTVRELVVDKIDEKYLKQFLNDPSVKVKVRLARRGVFLDDLLKSASPSVRIAVLHNDGYGAEQLAYDPEVRVRAEVAKIGKMLHVLAYDDSWEVRAEVAKHEEMQSIMLFDPSWQVRAVLAKRGLYLDELKQDTHSNVRIEAERYRKR